MSEQEQQQESKNRLKAELDRLKPLVPRAISDSRLVDPIEREIFNLIDGKRTCDELIKTQNVFSKDGCVLIILKLEKDGIISCVELVEHLNDVRFEKREAEKELAFLKQERQKLKNKITRKKEAVLGVSLKNKETMKTLSSFEEKAGTIRQTIKKLEDRLIELTGSVDQIVAEKKHSSQQKKTLEKSFALLKEEVLYLKDEKFTAMKSIRELETKINEVLEARESVVPKMSVYRGVVRQAYKTLHDAKIRADLALKGVE